MRWFIRLITIIFWTLFPIILLFSAATAYLIVTPLGGKMLVRYFKQEFAAVGLMHVGHYEGSLQNGFILKDIRMVGLTYLPNAVLRIQEVDVHIPLRDLLHYDCRIFNARLLMPDSDPVVFTGKVYAGQITGNLYAKSVDVYKASRFWTPEDIRRNLRGSISNVDLIVQGVLSSLNVKGSFLADHVQYKSMLLTDGFSRVNLTLIPSQGQVQVKGEVSVDSGIVNVRKIDLELRASKFIFKGDVFNPTTNIRLGAKVEDMDINLTVKGTLLDPQLLVSSDPPMPPQDALRVLFTGNAWGPSSSPFNGVTSGQLAQDFLNYSLQNINNDNQSFGLKTKLTSNLKLGLQMDPLPSPPGDTSVYYSRKINGEMDMNDNMSLNISREVLSQGRDPSQDAQAESETQIYMQYKKRF